MIFLIILIVLGITFGLRVSATISGFIISVTAFLLSTIVATGVLLGYFAALNQPIWAEASILVGLGLNLLSPKGGGISLTKPGYPGHYSFGLAILVVILLSLAGITIYLSEPANVDDLFYHYPKLFWLAQSHSFAVSGLEVVDGYPQNLELIAYFFTSLLGGIRLVDGIQLLLFPLYLASIWEISRAHGLSSRSSALATLLSCFVPAIWSLLTTFHVDFFASALVLGALALIYSDQMFSRSVRYLILGLILGLLLGSKFLALPWVLVILIGSFINSDRASSVWERLTLILPILFLGSATYLANAIRFGNPFYPYNISLFSIQLPGKNHGLATLWEEEMASGHSIISRIFLSWFSPDAIGQSNHEHWFGGLGVLWPLMLLSSLWVIYIEIRSKEYRFLYLGLLALSLFLLTPVNYTARFVLFLVPVGAVGFCILLDWLQSSRIKVLQTLLLSLVFVGALHVARQNFLLLSQELGGRRGATLTQSCAHVGRPDELRIILSRFSDSFLEASNLVVVLGKDRTDRLLSFGCFWALAPNAKVRFLEANEVSGATELMKSASAVIVSDSSGEGGRSVMEAKGVIFNGAQLQLYK